MLFQSIILLLINSKLFNLISFDIYIYLLFGLPNELLYNILSCLPIISCNWDNYLTFARQSKVYFHLLRTFVTFYFLLDIIDYTGLIYIKTILFKLNKKCQTIQIIFPQSFFQLFYVPHILQYITFWKCKSNSMVL